MRRAKLKNRVDFIFELFTEKANREWFAHMRKQRVVEAFEDGKVLTSGGAEGCLIWSVFKVNSPIYIGRKGDFQIKQIAVSGKSRGKGAAKKLFLKAKRIAETNKCPRMVLTVRNDNSRAQGFYKKMGMEKIKETTVLTKTKKQEMVYAEYALELAKNNLL